jgi:hypothetical protein
MFKDLFWKKYISSLALFFPFAVGQSNNKVLKLCDLFENLGSKPVDLFYAYRCMSVEVITCEVVGLVNEECAILTTYW